MEQQSVTYKKLPPVLIAGITAPIEDRSQIPALIEKLRQVCAGAICGPAMVIFHGGAVQNGFLVEVAYPVESSVEAPGVQTRQLEEARALTMSYRGAHGGIREGVLKMYDFLKQHAWTTSLLRREIYHTFDPDHPEANLTEIQIVLHEWERLLAEGAESVLGKTARQTIMQGVEKINQETSFAEYNAWIAGAIDRLDSLTDDNEKKCQVVSHCAHVFPDERIRHLKAIYTQSGDVDDVLREMYKDEFWYENPVRKGNVIYMRKNPYNPEAYASATTPAERRKAYCHCPFVGPYLDSIPAKLSTSFCFCGAGWYRRLWEGILDLPVKFEHVETLLKGNEQCTLTITLPLQLIGELSPEPVFYAS